MRCQEKAGFLLLRQCENPAELQCSQCGKHICTQHALPPEPPAEGEQPPPPTPRKAAGQASITHPLHSAYTVTTTVKPPERSIQRGLRSR